MWLASRARLHRGRFAAIAVMFAMIAVAAGQRNSSWMELPKKDAERLLANSPWSQTQVDTDASEMFYSPTRAGTSSIGQSPVGRGTTSDQQSFNNNRADRGAVNQEVQV